MADVKTKLTLRDGTFLEIDKFNGLKSVESLSQSTGQPSEIFYGAVYSSGTINIVDKQSQLYKLIINDILPKSNINIDIYANNSLVQNHLGVNSSYNLNDKQLSLDMSNEIQNFASMTYLENKYPTAKNLKVVLDNILQKASLSNYKYLNNLLSTNIVFGNGDNLKVGTVAEYLEHISALDYSFYNKEESLVDIINDICTIAQLNVIKKDNGDIAFISARPRIIDNTPIISIPLGRQLSSPEYDIILHNKYNNISYSKRSLSYESGEFVNETLTLLDDNNNLHLEDINGENIQIIKIDNVNYLCMFKTIESSNEFIICSNNRFYDRLNINYFSYGNDDNSLNNKKYPTDSSLTKETLDFKSRSVQVCQRLSAYSKLNSETFALKIPLGSTIPKQVKYIIRGFKYTLNNDDVLFNDKTDIFEFGYSGTLLHDKVYYIDEDSGICPLYDLIFQNILSDYANGIHTLNITVACSDYFDKDGNLIKSWANGDKIELGDIVRIDKDNFGHSMFVRSDNSDIIFKVTGRNFHDNGVPKIDLELQEVVDIQHNPMPKIEMNKIDFADVNFPIMNFIVENGFASSFFNIGDTRTIQLTNNKYATYILLDINHSSDTVSGSYSSNTISIGLLQLSDTTSVINNDVNKAGGYPTSDIRKIVQQQLYSLPIELQNIIKTTTKPVVASQYSFEEGISGIDYFDDKIWLFSNVEITGNMSLDNYPFNIEGRPYTYWTQHNTNADRIKYLDYGNGVAYNWAVRGTNTLNNRTFYYHVFNEYGVSREITPNTNVGICYGFNI